MLLASAGTTAVTWNSGEVATFLWRARLVHALGFAVRGQPNISVGDAPKKQLLFGGLSVSHRPLASSYRSANLSCRFKHLRVGVGRDAWGAGIQPRDEVDMVVYAGELHTWTHAYLV